MTPPTLQFVPVEKGLIAGWYMQLPVPSELADAIVFGRYEIAGLKALSILIEPEDVCYDIGGHYGVFTLHMARLATRGHVHTYEPIPRLSSAIEQSIARNSIEHVTVHQAAMSDAIGSLQMRAADEEGDDSMAYAHAHGGVQTPRSQVQYGQFQDLIVPSVTLDQCNAPPPRFLKMDIEGAEVAALRAGLDFIELHKPRMLIEVHGVERALSLAQLLGPIGYTAWQIASLAIAPQILWLHKSDQAAVSKLNQLNDPAAVPLFGWPFSSEAR